MVKPVNPVSQIPPVGGRRINVATEEGDTTNRTLGDGMEDGDSSWHMDTQNRIHTQVQSTLLLRNMCHSVEEEFLIYKDKIEHIFWTLVILAIIICFTSLEDYQVWPHLHLFGHH
ncbi:hypothetical protein JCGZ_10760 [Jatropha curcas]|uniref:Uncharacterized protein n=1 Tax=Jatropha curcas TaxID=180498 RepID=A0A067LI02_JATCU|nr:hypothetical protein JCGZ_10760 [Jatropha curcas]